MRLFYLLIILFSTISLYSQNTIGVLLNDANSLNAYTLFTAQTETYLINNCGEVVNQWSSNFPPGNAVYLLENGNLLRAARVDNPDINFGGRGGRIELFDWDSNLLWEYDYSTSLVTQHHDIYPMPNGNVLMLAITTLDQTQAIQAGRNPANLTEGKLFNEQILELQPVGTNAANIVWEWNIKDHFIQEFDNTKDNFGVINDNPQLLDINFLGTSTGNANWMHVNSIQYYENLDQIVLSARQLNEFYIIDHSTTTVEAAGHSGGTYGKGGDFLYRWGNPVSYGEGTSSNQKLFGQHYSHFIADGLVDAGKIILFNNGFNRTPSFSEVLVLTPPTDSPGVYSRLANRAYGPSSPDYTYIDPANATNFFSLILSSAQRLPNGNTLICDGDSGYFFEIDSNDNKVWEYINPVGTFGILTQGDNPEFSGNTSFRAIKYSIDYPAFNGKDLTPGAPIELNPDLSNCSILSVAANELIEVNIFPNPVTNKLTITSIEEIVKIEIYNSLGKLIKSNTYKNDIDTENLSSGIYIIKIFSIDKIANKKIIKI